MNIHKKRYLLSIYGIVQGVGFRPFVYNKAKEFQIYGWIKNSGGSVIIDLSGTEENVKNFILTIIKKPPVLAVIQKVQCSSLEYCDYDDFTIKESSKDSNTAKFISPDIAICNKCIDDIMDKHNKRYRYAFTNCTECGPRYSIIKVLPYDRESTTMNLFHMCNSCEKEYTNPISRRFHAQPNCCEECGPSLMLIDNKRKIVNCKDIIEKSIEFIKKGEIIAVKGIGGFHLVCDGKNEQAITKLRDRKKRPFKPLAIMVKDLKLIKEFCNVSEKEEKLLTGNKKPIVLLNKKTKCKLPNNIAPNNKKIGVMLPYTPLHYLLLEKKVDTLIMTSGNVSGSSIEYKNSEALERLNNIADYFLIHNREIYVPVDDSVTTVFNNEECLIRRGRGYAPFTDNLAGKDDIVALGPEEKSSISLSKNGYVYTSQYLGDLKDLNYYRNYEYVLNHLINLLDIKPKIIVNDMHPYYITTEYGKNMDGRNIKVQHHHAHMVSCMAEYNIYSKVIGVIYDGTGFGLDNSIWGGEFFVGTRNSFNRVGHLEGVHIQGGDASAKEPWRCAASYLYSLGYDIKNFIKDIKQENIEIVMQGLYSKFNCYESSSMGRLFDAVSALIGLKNYITYDGEAAIALENILDEGVKESYQYEINNRNGMFQISYKHIFDGIVKDLKNKVDKSIISAKFHNTVSTFTCDVVCIISKLYDINKVVLSGGVFQNQHLLEKTYINLKERGFRAFYNSKTPINDGGISYGQIAIANSILKEEEKKYVSCYTGSDKVY